MDTENFSFNKSTNSKVIKNFSAIFPWIGVSIFSDGFIIESINSCDLSCFMVSSQKCDVLGVFKLKTQQKLECLNWIESSINEITHENVSWIRNFTTFFEKFLQVMELSMDITADDYWCLHWLDITFFNKNFFDFFTQLS